MLTAQTSGNYPAPLEIMACVYEGLLVDIDQGLAIEAGHFAKVATSKEAGNLIKTLFLGLNEINKGLHRPKDIPKTDIKKVGIYGVSSMDVEIAYMSALAGIDVILKNESIEDAERVQNRLRERFEKGVDRGDVDPQKIDRILSFIKLITDDQDFVGCDLIIQSGAEEQGWKAQEINEAEPIRVAQEVLTTLRQPCQSTG